MKHFFLKVHGYDPYEVSEEEFALVEHSFGYSEGDSFTTHKTQGFAHSNTVGYIVHEAAKTFEVTWYARDTGAKLPVAYRSVGDTATGCIYRAVIETDTEEHAFEIVRLAFPDARLKRMREIECPSST
jgi:hypothetical protein